MTQSEYLTVFNIQRYSLHDGEGIRTVVFLKGCPLRCAWCSNPESQCAEPEILYVRNRCISVDSCGACIPVCVNGAISAGISGAVDIDANLCTGCLKCAGVCPSKAIVAKGEQMSIREIMDAVERDVVFFNRGGVTFSGGEPLYYGERLIRLLAEAKRRRISAAIETCGYGEYEILSAAAGLSDIMLYDIKAINNELHERFTGKPNTLILKNFEKLISEFPGLEIIARTPVIAGFNDSEDELEAIKKYVSRFDLRHELLPGHRLGDWKYEALIRRNIPVT